MDGFTKWAEAFPLKNKEAETIAKVLVEQVFARFGVPLSILSDQGKEVEVVYRRLPGSKMGEEDHSGVEEVLRLCHAGKVGGQRRSP